MRKVYVVIGEQGEYSDRSEWCVAAWETEEQAKAHVLAATVLGRNIIVGARELRENGGPYSGEARLKSPLDPSLGTSWLDEPSYYYAEVPLFSEGVTLEDATKVLEDNTHEG